MNSTTRRFRPARGARASARIMAMASLVLFATSCARVKEVAQKQPQAVSVTRVELASFALEAEYAARIQPAVQVNIIPKVGGRVASVRADVGDAVRKGQVLFTIEKGDFDAQLRQAAATLRSAQANLARSNDTGQESQLLSAQAAYDQAVVARNETKRVRDKTKRLFDQGAVSRQQMDDLDSRLKAAEIQLEAAKKNLNLVRDKSGVQASAVLSGQVDAARAQTDLAKSQLASTSVLSPLSGHVSFRDIEAGEMIGTSALAFIVIDDSKVLAEAALSDRSIGWLSKGMEVEVTIPALGALGDRKGVVDWVGPAVDPRTLLYPLRILLDNADGQIRPGMIARIRFPIEERRQVLLIPELSHFTENGLDYVMLARDGRAVKRAIVLGESDGSNVEVLSGLAEGDEVVTAGQEFLSDGDVIKVVK